MRRNRLEVQIFREEGGLRIEHRTRGDWGCAFWLTLAIFLPGLLIGILHTIALTKSGNSGWLLAGIALLMGACIMILKSDSKGTTRIDGEAIAVSGFGATSVGGDHIKLGDLEAIEFTNKYYGVPGDDETVVPGLHAVNGEQRICLVPRPDQEEAYRVMEEIARVVPELRSRIRWESCNKAF